MYTHNYSTVGNRHETPKACNIATLQTDLGSAVAAHERVSAIIHLKRPPHGIVREPLQPQRVRPVWVTPRVARERPGPEHVEAGDAEPLASARLETRGLFRVLPDVASAGIEEHGGDD